MPATPLNPSDLYDVRSLLSDEERMELYSIPNEGCCSAEFPEGCIESD